MKVGMKITRIINGEEIQIELTHSEMHGAYRIVEIEYLIGDVKSRMEEMEIDIPDNETLDCIAGRAQRSLEMNDGYWDAYWSSIEYAIGEEEPQ